VPAGVYGFCLCGVLFVAVQFREVVNVLFELLYFDGVFFLLLSEFVHFAGEADSLSIELDHDGSSDVVVDFP
jgi:hypothetical protein